MSFWMEVVVLAAGLVLACVVVVVLVDFIARAHRDEP